MVVTKKEGSKLGADIPHHAARGSLAKGETPVDPHCRAAATSGLAAPRHLRGGVAPHPPAFVLRMKTAARQVTEPAPARETPPVIHLGPPPDIGPPARHGSGKGVARLICSAATTNTLSWQRARCGERQRLHSAMPGRGDTARRPRRGDRHQRADVRPGGV